MKKLLMALVIVALAGCAALDNAHKNLKLKQGYPLSYAQGSSDGCDSGMGDFKRDVAMTQSNANYAQGWKDGYAECKTYMQNNRCAFGGCR